MRRTALSLLFAALVSGFGFSGPAQAGQRTEYERGREIFYKALRQGSGNLALADADLALIRKAEEGLPGLYEHLMNIYISVPRPGRPTNATPGGYGMLAPTLAEEFLDSLREFPRAPALGPVLTSCGYYAKRTIPIFRKHSRPMSAMVRAQWSSLGLGLAEAWTVAKGKGVRVAVVDTGVDPTIREVRNRIAASKDLLSSDSPGSARPKFPYDWGGHGTGVASIIVQLAPHVELLIVRIFDSPSQGRFTPTRWTIYLLAAGMSWALDQRADIINLSLAVQAHGTDVPLLAQTVKSCWERNVLVVAAAGRTEEVKGKDFLFYPAAYPWAIAVAGVERTRQGMGPWSGSAPGDYIDVAAPAADLLVETPSYLEKRPMILKLSGNSHATAVVTAISALMLSAMDATVRNVLKAHPGELADMIGQLLRQTASNETLGLGTPNPQTGYGVVSISRAVNAAKRWPSGEPLR